MLQTAIESKTAGAAAPRGARWVRHADLRSEALPNVMRKVLSHALG